MGLFAEMINVATSLFDSSGGSGGGWGSLIEVGGKLAGAYIQSEGIKSASDIYAQGNAAYLAELRAGQDAAQTRLDTLSAETRGGTDYLRRVVASDPYRLTPGQETGRTDNRIRTRENVAASGLRGSGRAQVAVINAADRRFTDSAIGSNIA